MPPRLTRLTSRLSRRSPGGSRRPLAARLPLACAPLLVALVGGCSSGGPGLADSSGSSHSPRYIDNYRAGRYGDSLRQASQAANSTTGGTRDEAALTAGLSAYALDRDAEAERWLEPLVRSRDPEIAGRAGATLGLIRRDQGKHALAAPMLVTAAEKLSGEERGYAAMYAGDSLAALGRSGEARAQYEAAMDASEGSPTLRDQVQDRLSGGAYTIQLGAFTTQWRAEKLVKEASAKAQAVGLEPPTTAPGVDRQGRTLHFVRVGRFPDENSAKDALRRLGLSGIVTTLAGGRGTPRSTAMASGNPS